jgi:hypothetical protein
MAVIAMRAVRHANKEVPQALLALHEPVRLTCRRSRTPLVTDGALTSSTSWRIHLRRVSADVSGRPASVVIAAYSGSPRHARGSAGSPSPWWLD